jgi:hypothetical protein
VLLFETDSFGHAVLSFRDTGVEAKVTLYDPRWVKLHAAKRPARVLVDSREQPFEYEAATVRVMLNASGAHTGAGGLLAGVSAARGPPVSAGKADASCEE